MKNPYQIQGIFLPAFLMRFIRRHVSVKYTALKAGTFGFTSGLTIEINKEISAADKAQTLEHEYVHIYQRIQLLWIIHVLLKLVSRRYRIYVEASAFAVSVRAGLSMDRAARGLATSPGYQDLGLTSAKAEKEIRKYLNDAGIWQ